MERKIGEIFDYNGVTLEVVEEDCGCIDCGCTGCYFIDKQCGTLTNLEFCSPLFRNDNKSVIFKEIKK